MKLFTHRAGLPGKEVSFILCPFTPPTRRGLLGTFRSGGRSLSAEGRGFLFSVIAHWFPPHGSAVIKRGLSNEASRHFDK